MSPVHSCLALVASICLNRPAEIELVQGWSWGGAKIVTGNLRITSTMGTDNHQLPDNSQVQKICISGKCFRYSRHCFVSMEEMHCKYYYVTDASPLLKEIEIVGPTMADIDKSWPGLSFAPYSDIRVGFDTLTFDNGSDMPPIDRSRGRP